MAGVELQGLRFVVSCHGMRFLTARLVAKKIESTIGRSNVNQFVPRLTAALNILEKIPGLGPLIEKITDSISSEWVNNLLSF